MKAAEKLRVGGKRVRESNGRGCMNQSIHTVGRN
jgi:hypothetical protein